MSAASKIEWTQATWNPVAGCSVISPGCTNCYAMKMAARCEAMGLAKYAGLTKPSKAGPVWTGEVRLDDGALTAPLGWRKPRRIFVNSMSDLFHDDLPDEAIDRVFAVMALAPQHTFQVLTKRAVRMRAYVLGGAARRVSKIAGGTVLVRWPLPNVWIGVSVEDQRRADERREHAAAVADQGWLTWVSYEPALGPVDWTGWEFIRWLVSGGESGRGARPSHPGWHREARDWCADHGVAYLFKQWGAWTPGENLQNADRRYPTKVWFDDGWDDCADDWTVEQDVGPILYRVGKKAAGRLLDGVEHNGFPSSRSSAAAGTP